MQIMCQSIVKKKEQDKLKYLDLALWLNINPESSSMVHGMYPMTPILSYSSYC